MTKTTRSFEMMRKIGATLNGGESIIIQIAHSGRWNGAHLYKVTNCDIRYIGHEWHSFGNLMYIYRERVLGRSGGSK